MAAMLSIDIIRGYCHIDYDDEDSEVELMWDAARQYITEAVGTYVDDDPVMQLLTLALINDMYEARTYTVTDEAKQSFTSVSMMRQLQLKYGDSDEDQGE